MKKYFTLLYFFMAAPLFAAGTGTSAGRLLTEPASARIASLASAVSAMKDDVAAMITNPSSLSSLSSSQASFLYQKGLDQDSFGSFVIGVPTSKGSFGVNVGYYDGGPLDYFNEAKNTTTSVQAKKDITFGLGYALNIKKISVGVSGKYISSELVETSKASAFAGDVGVQYSFSNHVTVGGALQNFGTDMTYVHDPEQLPRTARLGFLWSLPFSSAKLNMMGDAPYDINAAELRPALGLETILGPLALRAGYQTKNDLQNLSFGAGFLLGKASLDYSYGVVKDLSAAHRMSVSIKFGPTNEERSNVILTQPYPHIQQINRSTPSQGK